IPMGHQDEQRERALHRLRVLGVVDRYLVDFGGKRYDCILAELTLAGADTALISAIRRAQPARATAMAGELSRLPSESLRARVVRHSRRLTAFVYETIV